MKSSITDIDDPDSEIWVSVSSAISGSVQYDYSSGDLSFSWNEPGTQSITLTVVDRHGGWSTFNILVEVLDKKPLAAIDEDDITALLTPLWQTKRETAKKTPGAY